MKTLRIKNKMETNNNISQFAFHMYKYIKLIGLLVKLFLLCKLHCKGKNILNYLSYKFYMRYIPVLIQLQNYNGINENG